MPSSSAARIMEKMLESPKPFENKNWEPLVPEDKSGEIFAKVGPKYTIRAEALNWMANVIMSHRPETQKAVIKTLKNPFNPSDAANDDQEVVVQADSKLG